MYVCVYNNVYMCVRVYVLEAGLVVSTLTLFPSVCYFNCHTRCVGDDNG